jgi:hypothetical protein
MTPPEEAPRASRQVESILRAAEEAAEDLRRETEARADERIAEATRAADARVEAAEGEALEILAEAQRQASILHETAETDAGRIRREAEGAAARILEEAREQAGEVQRIAELFARETRDAATADAEKRVQRARDLAEEIFAEGSQLSHHLRQLSDSLQANARTLLDDVGAAHRALTSKLDKATGSKTPAPTPVTEDADFGDVPEFIPSAPRRR